MSVPADLDKTSADAVVTTASGSPDAPATLASDLSGRNPIPLEAADSDLHRPQAAGGDTGSVHSWELVTAVDGPGTRLTFFLAGCPLRCLYCHNPDTWQMRRGTRVHVDDLMKRVNRYAPVMKASGGGITLSGGEAMLQAAFVERVFAECKAIGVHTTLDTSGFLGARATDDMLDNTDLVLLDVKSGDPEIYKKVTGRLLEPTLVFGRKLSERGIPIWLRFVVVPGLTDGYDNVEKVAEYAASLSSVERVEVLPFHQMGREKWHELGENYPLEDTEPPSKELVERVRGQFEARGLTTY
ncbi:pyruvate formate-lyase-activating protein [Demequina flava]|uniref:pyruvate formate-lyase-activating protein n=1 Tax=Demequina flava TaxID=1095025 RepID=UPI0007848D8E|nr:pyruvate formate-lyase-activating protein [Demequina flava]